MILSYISKVPASTQKSFNKYFLIYFTLDLENFEKSFYKILWTVLIPFDFLQTYLKWRQQIQKLSPWQISFCWVLGLMAILLDLRITKKNPTQYQIHPVVKYKSWGREKNNLTENKNKFIFKSWSSVYSSFDRTICNFRSKHSKFVS